MKAVVVREFGTAASAKTEQIEMPSPGEREVLVKIKAVSANYVDDLVIRGVYQFLPPPPFVPGKGPSGVVIGCGKSVTRFKVGDRVLAMAEQGGYAEAVCVDEDQCYALPDALPFETAATVGVAFDTAWFALDDRARLKAGETVLVLGATGAVGYAAIQIAKAKGARVIAAVSSKAKADFVTEAGADHVVDLSLANLRDSLREQVYALTDARGADVVIDPLGGDVFDAAIRALAWRGRIVVIGFAAGRIPTIKANYLLVKNIECSGLQVSDYRKRTPDLMRAAFTDIFDMFAKGTLKPSPVKTYPLEDFATALADIHQRRVVGRAVLIP